MTSISNLALEGHRFYLAGGGLTVTPEMSYTAKFEVKSSGKWITNVDTNDLKFTSPQLYVGPDGRFTAPGFTFDLMNKTGYQIKVEVLKNDYPPQTLDLGLRWAVGNQFTFQGDSGRPADPKNPGQTGQTGPNVEVQAAYYDVTGTPLEGQGPFILVWVPLRGAALHRIAEGQISVVSVGGEGGKGGQGAPRYLRAGETEVYGEKGAPGGDGGDGGSIFLRIPNSTLTQHFTLSTPGGKPGPGGIGGPGEKAQKEDGLGGFLDATLGVNHGPSGDPGRPGRPGYNQVQILPISELFMGFSMEGFDRNRLKALP